MKKIRFMAVLLAAVFGSMAFSACSDEEEGEEYIFTLGSRMAVSEEGDWYEAHEALGYLFDMEEAYVKALGLSEGAGQYVILRGGYETLVKEMKEKFEKAELPEEPLFEHSTYHATFMLKERSVEESFAGKDCRTVVERVFTNRGDGDL